MISFVSALLDGLVHQKLYCVYISAQTQLNHVVQLQSPAGLFTKSKGFFIKLNPGFWVSTWSSSFLSYYFGQMHRGYFETRRSCSPCSTDEDNDASLGSFLSFLAYVDTNCQTVLCRDIQGEFFPIWTQDWASSTGNYMCLINSKTYSTDVGNVQVTTTD